MAFFGFGNAIGLIALLSLIPFLILYFIRPKPKEIVIPSVMFLAKGKDFRSKSGFFRRLFNDKLLLLQIIILGLISLFFAAPYLFTENVSSGNVFILLDTSASMEEDFEKLKASAINNLGQINTLIVIGSKASILLDEGSPKDARKELKKLKLMDSKSAVADSLVLANGLAKKIEGEKAIVILSDLIDTEDGDVQKELDAIKNSNIPLKILTFDHPDKDNTGVISLYLKSGESKAVVKNFCCEDKEIVIDYDGNSKKIQLSEGEIYDYEFSIKKGKSMIELFVNDAVESDNIVHIINPDFVDVEVLLISDGETKYIEAALEASGDIEVDKKSPNNVKGDYDVYILKDIGDISKSLSNFLKSELDSGKSLIVLSEDNLYGDYEGLLDFKIVEKVAGGDSSIVGEASFVNGLEFGKQSIVRKVYCEGKCDGVYVELAGQPAVMIRASGKGLVGYYGIADGGFKDRPDYPLFWIRFVKHLAGFKNLDNTNLNTGDLISFEEIMKFKTPSGKSVRGTKMLLDEAGFYEVAGVIYSVNLLSERESNLEDYEKLESNSDEISGAISSELIKKSIWKEILLLVLFLVLIEWIASARNIRRRKYNV